MATPSDSAPLAPDDVERRLHPLSWLFAVLQQLKSFALPLIVLIVTGRGNRYELFGLVGVVGIAVAALIQYATYRFRLSPDGIVITSGLLQRTRRDIPYDRVHNVVLHQSVLHRMFGVTEVRLESAGGQKAEGHMRVLSLADARALEELIRARGAIDRRVATHGPTGAATVPGASTLLRLPALEVIKLGLISNRGMVLIAAVVGASWQVLPDGAEPDDIVRWVYRMVVTEGRTLPEWLTGPVGLGAATVIAIIVALAAVRALSVVLALLQFHGFRLDEVGRQLRVERGLLTRVRLHVPRDRIQAFRLTETLLHRWFRRRSLRVDTAGGTDSGSTRGMRDLAPLATLSATDALVMHLLPGVTWPPPEWRRLHHRAWRRLVLVPSVIVGVLTALAVSQAGIVGAGLVLLLPVVFAHARLWARHTAYAEVPGGLIAVRKGWLTKSWRFAEVSKLQSLRITESPFDRRHDMATLWLDTAGASARDGQFRIPFLPAAEARALHDRLARGMES